jgi:hypothetical protein
MQEIVPGGKIRSAVSHARIFLSSPPNSIFNSGRIVESLVEWHLTGTPAPFRLVLG